MNRLLILIAIFSLSFSTACNLTKTYEDTLDMPDVKVDKGTSGNEVVFNDSVIEKKTEQKATFGESKKGVNQTTQDGSQITTMDDGHGNLIQTRYFGNHPNLKMMTVKTFADGHQEIIVFGHNGERKRVQPEMIQQSLTASGTDIANVAGIKSTKLEPSQAKIVKNTPPPFYPSATYPTPESFQNRDQTPPVTNETEPQTAESVEPKPVKTQPETPTQPDKNNTQLTQNRKPKEEGDQ